MPTRMLLLLFSIFLALVLGSSIPLAADQNDERLDALFEQLKEAPSVAVSTAIERKISVIWTQTPSKASEELMMNGIEAIQRGQLDLALKHFTSLVEGEPEFAEAWNKRATVHYMLGDYPEAIADIEKTLELEPRHFGALAGLGTIFAEIDQPEAARNVFQEVLELSPQSPGIKENIRKMETQMRARTL